VTEMKKSPLTPEDIAHIVRMSTSARRLLATITACVIIVTVGVVATLVVVIAKILAS